MKWGITVTTLVRENRPKRGDSDMEIEDICKESERGGCYIRRVDVLVFD